MNERGKEERGPTPQELNQQLAQILSQLPRPPVVHMDMNITDGASLTEAALKAIDVIKEVRAQRDSPEHVHRKALEGKLLALLSGAGIPPTFKDEIAQGFRADYTRGVNPNKREESETYWVLDEGDKDGGGIFGERAEELSSLGFRRTIIKLGYASNLQAATVQPAEDVAEYILQTVRFAKRKLDGVIENNPKLSSWKKEHTALFPRPPRI